MSTFGEMEDRIADDLNRTDLSTQIRKAINRAVDFYKKEPLWFTETSGSFTTSASAISYGTTDSNLPTDIDKIHYAEMTVSGSKYDLDIWPFEKLKNLNVTNSVGEPEAIAWWQNKLWFYQIPIIARTVTLYYTKSYPVYTANATGSTNDFMSYAEDLIEARSRWWVNSRIIKDRQSAQDDKAQEMDALEGLRSVNENYANTKVQPTSF